jgi:hypothetical protein
MADVLVHMSPEQPSGDIYARLRFHSRV